MVVVPTMRLSVPEREGVALFQRRLTAGSTACVPESSMVVVLAGAGAGQIMLNAQAKKKASARDPQMRITANSRCRERCR
jgi:hypothetical protein